MGSAMSSSMALALAGFCCSVIFIIFVCYRLACALIRRRRASRSRRAPPLPQYDVSHYTYPVHVARHSVGSAAGGGLDPAAVAAFPTRAFAATPRGSDASDDDSQGQDVLNQEMLTQGFTHVFSLTFASADDLTAYVSHEKHGAFAATFMAALEKVVVIDFPVVVAKPPPQA